MIHVLIEKLIDREGGYVNDPDDHGGPTNMGVTMETLTEWRGYPVNEADMQALTREEVAQIYYGNYWVKPGFVGLNRSVIIEEMLLDAAAHHGPAGAAKLLQLAVRVEPDGKIGPVTREAVNATHGPVLAANLMAERVAKLGRIIEKDRSQAKYAAGWFSRMRSFIKIIPMA